MQEFKGVPDITAHEEEGGCSTEDAHRAWPSASAPQPYFLSWRMDMQRAGNPQAAAGTKPTFPVQAFTNQYPSQQEAAGSNLVLH